MGKGYSFKTYELVLAIKIGKRKSLYAVKKRRFCNHTRENSEIKKMFLVHFYFYYIQFWEEI